MNVLHTYAYGYLFYGGTIFHTNVYGNSLSVRRAYRNTLVVWSWLVFIYPRSVVRIKINYSNYESFILWIIRNHIPINLRIELWVLRKIEQTGSSKLRCCHCYSKSMADDWVRSINYAISDEWCIDDVKIYTEWWNHFFHVRLGELMEYPNRLYSNWLKRIQISLRVPLKR